MLNVYEYREYKTFVLAWIKAQPKEGHGQLSKLAAALRTSPVVMTQVFRGTRDLTAEQALGVARFLAFSQPETEYFLLLVQRARAGTMDLAAFLDAQITKQQSQSRQIRHRIEHESLDEAAKAQFYSSWHYSALRLGLAIPGTSVAALAQQLGMNRARALEITEFLLRHGLLEKTKSGYALGPAVLHLGHDHPLIERHHGNWRGRAIASIERDPPAEQDFHYTGPMVISASLAEAIKKELLKLIEQLTPKIRKAENEQLNCLTIDWFRVY